ncbi:MAG: aldose epimerase family protein [Robiginitalea sp.]|uniref:aldose epimerase family protein n=1 Tax=Robiginitalea sp. TaxID=1902411 RepID=UPI003C7500A8
MKQVTVKNKHLSLEVLEYGAIIRKLKFRTRANSWTDVNVSLESTQDYLNDTLAIGACVGRYAGRLSGGNLELDGKYYPLTHTEGITLHGGDRGFSRQYWNLQSATESPEKSEVTLTYRSGHLEEGFPGILDVTVTYTLLENVLIIRHEATTDRPTVVNLTNHTYFKIDSQPLISHYQLQINALNRAETNSRRLPTGQLPGVASTTYDFLEERPLGDFKMDTPFLLDSNRDFAARLTSAVSGIRLTVHTNQPGLVVYTPEGFAGICFETQNLPDAPRFDHFPDARLNPGETYVNESHFVFESLR